MPRPPAAKEDGIVRYLPDPVAEAFPAPLMRGLPLWHCGKRQGPEE